MKLEYKIIWVDDTTSWVASVIGDIKEYLEETGCEPVIEVLEDGDGLVDKCKREELDLLIVDNNLPGDDGNVLISKIRESGKFTEVVFYSQDQPSKELIGVVDGVFHCQRADAIDKIKMVIDLTLHKLKDLGVVRGLVIASAIDIEVRLEELMVKLFKESGSLFRERILDEHYLDCAKKFTLLQGALKDLIAGKPEGEAKQKLKAAKETLNGLDREIIDQRNILAHSKRVVREGKIILEGINTRTRQVTFDTQWISKVRTDLRKHLQNLDTIEELLGTGEGEQPA